MGTGPATDETGRQYRTRAGDQRAAADAHAGDRSPLPRWYLGAVAVAALVVVLALAWLHFAVGGERTTQLFSDGVVALGAVAAALATTRIARTGDDLTGRGWGAFAVGMWLEAAGELAWVTLNVATGSAPYPGLPDVFYLAGYPFLAAGFVLLAVDSRDRRPWVRFTLDGLVVATALLTLGWHFVLEPLLTVAALSDLETWVSLAYPVLDVVVASIAFVVAMHARGRRRGPLLVVAAGISALVVADVTFAAFEFGEAYVYDELGLFWLVGYLAVALGALHPDAAAPPDPGTMRHYHFRELVFPFAPFLVAMGVVTAVGYWGALDRGDVVLAGLVVAFLVARQAHVSRDAVRLGRELEASERLLAARNEELLLVNRIVRHDIRNDMAVANGWAGELRGHVDGEGEAMLERVIRTTEHTIDLTETLRDFVEALEPGREAPVEPTPLREVLSETILRCGQTYPHAIIRTGDLPDVDVRANSLLGTVFRNLINNAVQHSDVAEPHVEVTAETSAGTVQVRIADDGPGVPDERKATVFGRGEKGLESGGTGVGLYLVETLVSQYGGDVWIEDGDPRGAVFVVELPLAA